MALRHLRSYLMVGSNALISSESPHASCLVPLSNERLAESNELLADGSYCDSRESHQQERNAIHDKAIAKRGVFSQHNEVDKDCQGQPLAKTPAGNASRF